MLAYELILLDKTPELTPIDSREVIPRIIGKAVTNCLRCDIINTNSSFQLCIGIKSGCEVAVQRQYFEDEGNHGIFQIDASNAFNIISRAFLLHNMSILCPEFVTYVYNYYKTLVRLYISDRKEMQFTEVTT